jgi:hypothetical protein
MSQFTKIVTTQAGQALVAKILSGTSPDTPFIKVQTSSEVYDYSELETLTALDNVEQETVVSQVIRESDTTVRISASMDNALLATGYINNTMGIIANDPDDGSILFGVTIVDTTIIGNQASFIPAFDGHALSGMLFDFALAIGNSENVSMEVSSSALVTIVMHNMLKEVVDKHTDEIHDTRGYVGYAYDDIYGVEVDYETGVITRLANSVGLEGGDDHDHIQCFGGRRRCVAVNTGEPVAFYGEPAFIANGKLAVDVGSNPIGADAQVMVYQPAFYYKVVPLKLRPSTVGFGYSIRKARYYVSPTPKDGFKIHPAFVRNGIPSTHVLIGAFPATVQTPSVMGGLYMANNNNTGHNYSLGSGYRLASIGAGQAAISPSGGPVLSRRSAADIAANRGIGWQGNNIAIQSATLLLMLVEYATFDIQSVVGLGAVNQTNSMTIQNGGTLTLGNKTGMATGANGTAATTYRGEESVWGHCSEMSDGINIRGVIGNTSNAAYIASDNFNDTSYGLGSDYNYVGFTMQGSTPLTNIKYFGYGYPEMDWLFLCSEVTASTSVINSTASINATTAVIRQLVISQSYNTSQTAKGMFAQATPNAGGSAGTHIGVRLVYRPDGMSEWYPYNHYY